MTTQMNLLQYKGKPNKQQTSKNRVEESIQMSHKSSCLSNMLSNFGELTPNFQFHSLVCKPHYVLCLFTHTHILPLGIHCKIQKKSYLASYKQPDARK